MENSIAIKGFLIKADNYRTDSGFAFYSTVGLIQYALLLGGITLIITSTSILLWKIIRRNKT